MSSAARIRVAVFVDGANLYNRLRDCHWPARADINRLGRRLAGNRAYVGTWYYNVPAPRELPQSQIVRQRRYYARLASSPKITFTLGYLQRRVADGRVLYEEKGVDISLAVDMLTGAFEDRYDTAVLVSSDGDFKPVVEAVRRSGRRVGYVYFPGPRRSRALVACANIARQCRRAWIVEI